MFGVEKKRGENRVPIFYDFLDGLSFEIIPHLFDRRRIELRVIEGVSKERKPPGWVFHGYPLRRGLFLGGSFLRCHRAPFCLLIRKVNPGSRRRCSPRRPIPGVRLPSPLQSTPCRLRGGYGSWFTCPVLIHRCPPNR